MKTYVLGMFGNFYRGTQDPSAVLLKDGKIVAAAEEERFIRVKHAIGQMPQEAVRFCLNKAGISMDNVDVLAFPQITWSDMRVKLPKFLKFQYGGLPKKMEYIEHHYAHAASAFYSSGFKESMIFTADWSGDGVSTTFAYGHDGTIEFIEKLSGANYSLGVFYSILTQFLGFRKHMDEYKVMGLAAHGKPSMDFSWFMKETETGFEVDTQYLNSSVLERYPADHGVQEPSFDEKFIERVGQPRLPGQPITEWHKDLAASGQKALERTGVHLVSLLHRKTESRNICLAGGVGLNCTMNGMVKDLDFVDNIFVPPVPGDNGIALGAAQEITVRNGKSPEALTHTHFGPEYTSEQILTALERSKCDFEYCTNVEHESASLIAENKIVGWFQGAMEFGPRALGNRSILADPRKKDMRDRINRLVKFREDFRPLAPSVLEQSASEFFESVCASPFMTISFKAKSECAEAIPAVIAADGTSRIQTVTKDSNALYYALIEKFEKETGVPMVLNTSLNLNWEPIVMTPEQALATFHATGMDYLFLGRYLVRKTKVS